MTMYECFCVCPYMSADLGCLSEHENGCPSEHGGPRSDCVQVFVSLELDYVGTMGWSLTSGLLPTPSLGLPPHAVPSFPPAWSQPSIWTFASVHLPEDTGGRSRESEALGNEEAIHAAIPSVFIATMPALMGSEHWMQLSACNPAGMTALCGPHHVHLLSSAAENAPTWDEGTTCFSKLISKTSSQLGFLWRSRWCVIVPGLYFGH